MQHSTVGWRIVLYPGFLLENQQTTVVVASTPARRATLRKHWPDYVSTNAELLGSCSVVACRGLMPKELGRVNARKRVLTLLACTVLVCRLNLACVPVEALLFLKWLMGGSLGLLLWRCAKPCFLVCTWVVGGCEAPLSAAVGCTSQRKHHIHDHARASHCVRESFAKTHGLF